MAMDTNSFVIMATGQMQDASDSGQMRSSGETGVVIRSTRGVHSDSKKDKEKLESRLPHGEIETGDNTKTNVTDAELTKPICTPQSAEKNTRPNDDFEMTEAKTQKSCLNTDQGIEPTETEVLKMDQDSNIDDDYDHFFTSQETVINMSLQKDLASNSADDLKKHHSLTTHASKEMPTFDYSCGRKFSLPHLKQAAKVPKRGITKTLSNSETISRCHMDSVDELDAVVVENMLTKKDRVAEEVETEDVDEEAIDGDKDDVGVEAVGFDKDDVVAEEAMDADEDNVAVETVGVEKGDAVAVEAEHDDVANETTDAEKDKNFAMEVMDIAKDDVAKEDVKKVVTGKENTDVSAENVATDNSSVTEKCFVAKEDCSTATKDLVSMAIADAFCSDKENILEKQASSGIHVAPKALEDQKHGECDGKSPRKSIGLVDEHAMKQEGLAFCPLEFDDDEDEDDDDVFPVMLSTRSKVLFDELKHKILEHDAANSDLCEGAEEVPSEDTGISASGDDSSAADSKITLAEARVIRDQLKLPLSSSKGSSSEAPVSPKLRSPSPKLLSSVRSKLRSRSPSKSPKLPYFKSGKLTSPVLPTSRSVSSSSSTPSSPKCSPQSPMDGRNNQQKKNISSQESHDAQDPRNKRFEMIKEPSK